LRGSSDDGDNFSLQYSSRRTFNYDDASGPSSSIADDLTSRSSRQSLRLSSRYSTDSDLETDSSSRFTSKYKSLLSGTDNDDYSLSRYSRYGSRDETANAPSSSTRVTRYSSMEGDDDFGLSTSTTRRKTRLSYLDEEGGGESSSVSSYTRRFTSDSLDDSYKVTTPTDEESKYSLFHSVADPSEDFATKRRFQSTSRTLSRTDSKDAVSAMATNSMNHWLR